MPLYEFRCEKCHTRFEALCRTYSSNGVNCPTCNATKPARLISTFAMSRQLTPCGTPKSEMSSGCGFNPAVGGCGRCQS